MPLWVYFVAAQWLDIFWAVFVLLGIEKLRIVPGITEANPYDLYYNPYSHSLAGALALSLLAGAALVESSGDASTASSRALDNKKPPRFYPWRLLASA